MTNLPIGFRILRDGVEVDAVRYERAIVKVGKMPSAHLRLEDDSVSRIHCIIETGYAPSIIDLGSRSGTRVNGVRVNRAPLRRGDRIDIGVFTLIVELTMEVPRIEMRRLAGSPDRSQPITSPIPIPEKVTLDGLGAGLPAPRPAAVHLHGVRIAEERVERRDPLEILRMSTEDAKAFAGTLRDRKDLDELLGSMLIVAIDKVREQQADPELGELYTQAIECLGLMTSARSAPSLLVALMAGLPKGSGKAAWRANACAAIATHPACWPYLARVAELPGFAVAAAHAAVKAGREPAPWLAHPFWQVRLAAARAIRDDVARTGALASVWESFARSDVPVEDRPRAGHRLRVPRSRPWRDFDWRRAAKRQGIEIETLPDLPEVTAGLESPCADFRAWTQKVLVRPQDRTDAAYLSLDDDDREAILDNERCELLAALIHLEAVGKELQAKEAAGKTPVLPDA